MMSLTDEIYQELLDGLGKDLNWQQFLAKHSASKGPLYNAIGRFFTEIEPRLVALDEEKRQVQSEVDEARSMMDSLDHKMKEAESNITNLKGKENALNKQIKTLEARLLEKNELVKYLEEMEKLGFNSGRLRQLFGALEEIGTKYGLRGQQIVKKFFNDLKEYGALFRAKLQLEGLHTQIETKKFETENWQAKEEALKRKYADSKEAIEAVNALLASGMDVKQITTWHRILSQFETVEEFDENLAKYGDMVNLLKAEKEEAKNWESKRVKAQSQTGTLEKRRVIEVQKEAGIKELRAVAAAQIREIRSVSQEARSQFRSITSRLDASFEKVFELGQKCERVRQELQKYEGVKDILESHSASSEEEQ
jgi:chromosome segregation ATPase